MKERSSRKADLFVRPVQTCQKLSISIILAQVSLRSLLGLSLKTKKKGLMATPVYIQAWERPQAISGEAMRRIFWRCTRGTSCTGPWRSRRGLWLGRQSAGSSAQLGHTVQGDSASVTQVCRLYLYNPHFMAICGVWSEWNLPLIGVSQLTSLPLSFSLLTLIIWSHWHWHYWQEEEQRTLLSS